MADEIEWCHQFYKQHPLWVVVDISNKAIEEVSAALLGAYRRNRRF